MSQGSGGEAGDWDVLDELFTAVRPEDFPARIERCRQILGATSREADPLFWASLQETLGLLLAQNPFGGPADQEEAIQAFEKTLEVFTRETHPLPWAGAMINLANALMNLQVDQAVHLERAVGIFESVLEELDEEEAAPLRAQVLVNLATALRLWPRGGQADTLETVLGLLHEALAILTPEEQPGPWAEAFASLGLAYLQRPRGGRRENLELAIDAFQQAMTVHTVDAAPWEYARHLMNRTLALVERVEGERAENLEIAISDLRLLLDLVSSNEASDLWAALMIQLGNALIDRLQGERAGNLEEAKRVFDRVLALRPREAAPIEWAHALMGRATALRDQVRGDRDALIEQALEDYERVLEVFRREEHPLEWALAHLNRAAAWQDRLRGDRGDNLQRCIADHLSALEVLDPENTPGEWGNAQMTLGNAYYYRVLGNRSGNLERALEAYDRALTVLSATDAPYDWALTQANRAMVLREREAGDPAENLERAITAAESALTVFTPDSYPVDWGKTLNTLGAIYQSRLREDRKANLETAVGIYERALRTRGREAMPAAWANSRIGMATAFSNLFGVSGDPAFLDRCREILESLLQDLDPDTSPSACRVAAQLLGDVCCRGGQWPDAVRAYRLALRASAALQRSSALRTSRHDEMADSADLHQWAAYAMARNGEPREAAVTLERGRARGLSEALARDHAELDRVRALDPDAFEMYQTAVARVRQAEIQERGLPGPGREEPAAWRADLRAEIAAAQADLERAVLRIRALEGFSSFLQEPELPEIADAARPGRPLVYLSAIPLGGMALIVAAGSGEPEIDVLWLDGLATAGLLTRLDSYLAALRSLATFRPVLEELQPWLRERMLNLLELLRERWGAGEVVLVPGAHFGLLPLHAALIDDIEVSYAPSARVLNAARRALESLPGHTLTLAGVGDPQPATAPLPYSALEIAGIASLFAPSARQVLLEERATSPALLQELPRARYAHLACHGEADLEEPLESRLHLADGPLSLRDVLAQGRLAETRLVALSACQTALIEFRRLPDEALGLPAGFLQNGAPCVVASLWQANDLATAFLMIRFYRLHLAGDPTEGIPPLAPAAALRRAQLWLRQATTRELRQSLRIWRPAAGEAAPSGIEGVLARLSAQATARLAGKRLDSQPFSSPSYWAPFILLGE